MIALATALVGLGLISLLIGVAIKRPDALRRGEHWGVLLTAGGLVGAAPGRFLNEPAGVFDLMFLAGILTWMGSVLAQRLGR